jgi:formylmethanofuran dehydrogenase subunit E
MTTGSDESWKEDFKSCVEFHGHACPGLAMGYMAAKAGMVWLNERRAADEEIVAVVETDACGCDAVQVITGCTFGKGNFVFKDYGKTAFSFLSRSSGKGVRLASRPGGFSLTPEHRALFEKVWSNTAGEEDLKEFWGLHRQRTLDVLNKSVDDLYILQEISLPIPHRAKVFNSRVCGRCGESVMASRLTETKSGPVCRACLEIDQESGN